MQNKPKNIDAVISYFQTKPDIGGFVIQKIDEKLEFDTYFSDEFLGKTPEEAYTTMIVAIAAMRSMADDLTKKIITASGLAETEVRKNIADIYYEIQKSKLENVEDQQDTE